MITTTTQFLDSDMIVLNTIESYLRNLGVNTSNIPPEAHLTLVQNARDYLYSEIVQRVPAIATKLLHADLDIDDRAKALYLAITDHVMDPIFVQMLLQYLGTVNRNQKNNRTSMVVGALLAKILSKYIEDHTKAPTNKKEKDKKEEAAATSPSKSDLEKVAHIQEAVKALLGPVADIIATRCGNLNFTEALAIAACISTNDETTITEIIASNLPITADIFNILVDPSEIIRAALLLEKKDYTKLTENQEKFIESLRRWVLNKLDKEATQQQAYAFLLSVYGPRPDTNKYLVNIKDCGTSYPNLLTVAKFMTN